MDFGWKAGVLHPVRVRSERRNTRCERTSPRAGEVTTTWTLSAKLTRPYCLRYCWVLKLCLRRKVDQEVRCALTANPWNSTLTDVFTAAVFRRKLKLHPRKDESSMDVGSFKTNPALLKPWIIHFVKTGFLESSFATSGFREKATHSEQCTIWNESRKVTAVDSCLWTGSRSISANVDGCMWFNL